MPLNSILAGAGEELDAERPRSWSAGWATAAGWRRRCSARVGSTRTTSRAAWRPGRPRDSRFTAPDGRPPASSVCLGPAGTIRRPAHGIPGDSPLRWDDGDRGRARGGSRRRWGRTRSSPTRSRYASTRATHRWWRAAAGSSRSLARPTTSSPASRSRPRTDFRSFRAGSGTGLAGGATPIGDALVVVTTKMNRILEVRPQDRLAWVEPGVSTSTSRMRCAPAASRSRPIPPRNRRSTIGGNVSTNAGGPHCLAYGVTLAHVLALDVVLPDGSVERLGSRGPRGCRVRPARTGGRVPRGRSASSTACCVRLTPLPPAVRTMLLDFTTVENCAATVCEIIARRRRSRRYRDDGPGHRGGRRELRARRVPGRRCGDPDRGGGRRGGRRGRAGRARSKRRHTRTAFARSAWPPTTPSVR